MRKFFRYAMQALVLILVFLVSAMTAMRFAIHGRETTVPKLIGLSPADAAQTLAKQGLFLQRDTRYFSSTVPAGKIVSQNPPEGERVRRGWRVRVAESMGPQRTVIPDLVGESERAAALNIRRRGLDLGTVATMQIGVAGSEADTVVAQSPPANATGVVSPKVSVLVSDPGPGPTYVMPDLTGLSLDTVIKVASDAGFKIGEIRTVASTLAAQQGKNIALVVGQSPSPGQRIAMGAAINVDVTR